MKKRNVQKTKQQGFTLLEIIVVITIIAIMASYIAPKVTGFTGDTRIKKAKSDIIVLESSLELYKLDNFRFPTTDEGLKALKAAPESAKNWRKGGYVKRLFKDPWGNEYLYANPGSHEEIDIYTLGADGAEGGEGDDTDIGNWNLDK